MVFRVAASLTALLTLSLVASWFSGNNRSDTIGPELASLFSDIEIPGVADLQEPSAIIRRLPSIAESNISVALPEREAETTVENIESPALPSVAFSQVNTDGIGGIADSNRATEDAINVIPRQVFGLPDPVGQLALMDKNKPA